MRAPSSRAARDPLALGGFLYFVESNGSRAIRRKQEKVFAVEADKIEEVTVHSESGERTTLKKTGADWQISAPGRRRPTSAESPASPPTWRARGSSAWSTRSPAT